MPCEKVGGDFYNVFRLDDQNIGVLIGDVAGHGVSAAMIKCSSIRTFSSKSVR